MSQHGAGPAGSGDQLRQAVEDLYAVRQFLEAAYHLPEEEWLDVHDGLAHVMLAAERLAATLAARCPEAGVRSGHVEALAAVQDLLDDARTLLNQSFTPPGGPPSS
jgi:hypothetical protein